MVYIALIILIYISTVLNYTHINNKQVKKYLFENKIEKTLKEIDEFKLGEQIHLELSYDFSFWDKINILFGRPMILKIDFLKGNPIKVISCTEGKQQITIKFDK